MRSSAIGSWSSLWITRRSGRAPEGRLEASFDEVRERFGAHVEGDASLAEELGQASDLELGDRTHDVHREPAEDELIVEAVQELGPEEALGPFAHARRSEAHRTSALFEQTSLVSRDEPTSDSVE